MKVTLNGRKRERYGKRKRGKKKEKDEREGKKKEKDEREGKSTKRKTLVVNLFFLIRKKKGKYSNYKGKNNYLIVILTHPLLMTDTHYLQLLIINNSTPSP